MEVERQPTIPFQRLKHLPNTEADLLEQLLGIKFQAKPTKIPLTQENRTRLALFYAVFRIRHGELCKKQNKQPTLAEYFSSTNTFFYWPTDEDSARFLSFHENTHAYRNQHNPSLQVMMEATDAMGEAVRDKAVTGNIEPLRHVVEQRTTIKCLDEGLANWCAAEAEIRRLLPEGFIDLHRRVGNQYHQKLRFGVPDLHSQVDLLEQYDQQFVEQLRTLDTRNVSRGPEVRAAPYYAGYHFVDEAMTSLNHKGLSIQESLDMLIDHPPIYYDHIREPMFYLHDLLN